MVHQARSVDHVHSLHLTVSTYQLFDWTQYLEKVRPGKKASGATPSLAL